MITIEKYITSLMKDKRNDVFSSLIKGLLWIISLVYLLSVRIIGLCYQWGIRREHKVPSRVISIGNITLGGTGKTPFTLMLAEYFKSIGMNPAILIRGYGSDENRMLKDELPDVPVLVGQDRLRNALSASSGGNDVIILDDGFQHRRLSRDIDIVLIDSVSFPGNKCLFPRGTLREPLTALKRADIIVLTKTDMIDKDKEMSVMEIIGNIAPDTPVAGARHKPVSLSGTGGEKHELEIIRDKKAGILSGIGDPEYFYSIITDLGAEVVSRHEYPDHYAYTQTDIDNIFSDINKNGIECIITTKKDFVKINELDISRIREKLMILNISMEIVHGKEFLIAGFDIIGISPGA